MDLLLVAVLSPGIMYNLIIPDHGIVLVCTLIIHMNHIHTDTRHTVCTCAWKEHCMLSSPSNALGHN